MVLLTVRTHVLALLVALERFAHVEGIFATTAITASNASAASVILAAAAGIEAGAAGGRAERSIAVVPDDAAEDRISVISCIAVSSQ
jgi:hypothetical protein